MSPAAHSDEVYGLIAGTMDVPRQEVAADLGWTVDQVKTARSRIRSGWAPVKTGWTDDEDYIIRSSPLLTARQLTALLPGRAWQSIKKRRSEISALDGLPKHAFRSDPMAPAGRTLIAKTCTACGELRPGTAYRWRSQSKTWRSDCVYCESDRTRGNRERSGYSSQPGNARRQAVSLTRADRNGQEYTDTDISVLKDATLTTLQKALRIHHSYYATSSAVSRMGFASAPPSLGDPETDVWAINNPNLDRILLEVSA